jgi:RNA polymerase sigma factor (sigma-70 family)
MREQEACELIAALYEATYAPLLRFACHLIGQMEAAEDVVQEAFLRLHRSLLEGRRVANYKAWLYCSVRREVYRRLQAPQQVEMESLSDVPIGPWIQSIRELEFDEVSRRFAVLTRREEEVLLLRLTAMSYREIAGELGINVGSVSVLLSRAIRKLQDSMRGEPRQGPEGRRFCGRKTSTSTSVMKSC